MTPSRQQRMIRIGQLVNGQASPGFYKLRLAASGFGLECVEVPPPRVKKPSSASMNPR